MGAPALRTSASHYADHPWVRRPTMYGPHTRSRRASRFSRSSCRRRRSIAPIPLADREPVDVLKMKRKIQGTLLIISMSMSRISENYKNIFAQYGAFEIQTGNSMVSQFHPWYLGMANPFTMPHAVGGYDVPNHPRWRRPADEDLPYPRATFPDWLTKGYSATGHNKVGLAAKVRLFDITRGLP